MESDKQLSERLRQRDDNQEIYRDPWKNENHEPDASTSTLRPVTELVQPLESFPEC